MAIIVARPLRILARHVRSFVGERGIAIGWRGGGRTEELRRERQSEDYQFEEGRTEGAEEVDQSVGRSVVAAGD